MEDLAFKEIIKQDVFNDGKEKLDIFFKKNSISNRLRYYINNKTEILSLFSNKDMRYIKKSKENCVALMCIILDIKKNSLRKALLFITYLKNKK